MPGCEKLGVYKLGSLALETQRGGGRGSVSWTRACFLVVIRIAR